MIHQFWRNCTLLLLFWLLFWLLFFLVIRAIWYWGILFLLGFLLLLLFTWGFFLAFSVILIIWEYFLVALLLHFYGLFSGLFSVDKSTKICLIRWLLIFLRLRFLFRFWLFLFLFRTFLFLLGFLIILFLLLILLLNLLIILFTCFATFLFFTLFNLLLNFLLFLLRNFLHNNFRFSFVAQFPKFIPKIMKYINSNTSFIPSFKLLLTTTYCPYGYKFSFTVFNSDNLVFIEISQLWIVLNPRPHQIGTIENIWLYTLVKGQCLEQRFVSHRCVQRWEIIVLSCTINKQRVIVSIVNYHFGSRCFARNDLVIYRQNLINWMLIEELSQFITDGLTIFPWKLILSTDFDRFLEHGCKNIIII